MFIYNLNVLIICREFLFHKMCHQIHVAETAVSEQQLGAELLLPCLCCVVVHNHILSNNATAVHIILHQRRC